MAHGQPRKHHFVPQGYLRNFTNADGKLHMYSKKTNQRLPASNPKDVAFGKNFHTLKDRMDPVEIERRLDREFEAPLIGTINRLLSRVRLRMAGLPPFPIATQEERELLARFVALQRVRTNQVRREIESKVDEVWTPDLSLDRKEFAKRSHLELLEKYMDDGFDGLVRAINRRLVFLTTTPDRPFHTSDHPVTVARGALDGSAYWGGVGLNEEFLELYFPLSSDVTAVFVGTHIKGSIAEVHEIKPEALEGRNAVTFANAHELVFASEPITPSVVRRRLSAPPTP